MSNNGKNREDHDSRLPGHRAAGRSRAKRTSLGDAPQRPVRSQNKGPTIGMLEWFRPGEHDRVDRVLDDLCALGIKELRTGISWADAWTPEGEAWYAWLFPQLARRVELLPCFMDTPPSWGVAPKTSAPPGNLKMYADFLDTVITRYGKYFEWVELWNEPNDPRRWDRELDPYWLKFGEMIGNAAHWARHRGKRTVLGGMRPIDPGWLRLMGERKLLEQIDAVGVHAFPGTSESQWQGWAEPVERVRAVFREFNPDGQVWITETGYSTWRHDERRQLTSFVDATSAPVERVYWYGTYDLDPRLSTGDGFHNDERDYHFGLRRADGGQKLLYRLWAEGGLDAVRDNYWIGKSAHVNGNGAPAERPVLITGGCGFIGTNVAHRILSSGHSVLLYDNLSRPGVEKNLKWLRQTHGDLMRIEAADVQDSHALRKAVERSSRIFHFAAQVAVTTSLVNAGHDFDVNARGTLNLLEAIRMMDDPPPLMFTSTNKVYGGLPDLAMRRAGQRYEPVDDHTREHGVGEARPLDFHRPYGCSKGTADQYVIDYARTFGLPTTLFRMSCIYGPHQFGTEDQGWVAHFLIRALRGEPITIYGDGCQVRDVLFIDDLVDAFLLAGAAMPGIAGQPFNVGGGPQNVISLIDLLDLIEEIEGHRPQVRYGAWRPGDQRYYVSDTRKLTNATGWKPQVSVAEGVRRLHAWLQENADLPKSRRRKRMISIPGEHETAEAWRDSDDAPASNPAPTSGKEAV
jgi:CDP-paratose 2-epimerase